MFFPFTYKHFVAFSNLFHKKSVLNVTAISHPAGFLFLKLSPLVDLCSHLHETFQTYIRILTNFLQMLLTAFFMPPRSYLPKKYKNNVKCVLLFQSLIFYYIHVLASKTFTHTQTHESLVQQCKTFSSTYIRTYRHTYVCLYIFLYTKVVIILAIMAPQTTSGHLEPRFFPYLLAPFFFSHLTFCVLFPAGSLVSISLCMCKCYQTQLV